MKTNDIYEIKIIDEDNIGNGIAKIDNFVIFISNALKDEILKIQITEVNKRFAKAKIIEFIEKSNRRKEVECDCYDSCGACSFLHIDFKEEKEKKLNEISKLFNKEINILRTDNEYNYRNKATFHVKDNKIGYYSEKTNDLVELTTCKLLDKRINDIYNHFKSENLSGIEEIMIRVTKSQIMLKITSQKDFDKTNLINKFNIDSIYLNKKLIHGNAYITEELNNIKYTIYPNAFFQVNTQNMKIMYDLVKQYAGKANNLLDLYCGTGTIGIYLSENFNNVTGVEINSQAIMNATINKELNHIENIKFLCADASIIKEGTYDVIVVDPPRSGLSKDVINYLNKSNALRIVYVSCNPKTLKRDLELLNNYELKNIECINMFNKTKHLETVCLLERK